MSTPLLVVERRHLARAVALATGALVFAAVLATLGELQLVAAATLALAQESHRTLADLAARGASDPPAAPPIPNAPQESPNG